MYLTVLCEKNECKRVQVSNLENSLPVYIKYMAMCNACGNSSSLVLIVAIDELPEDSFHVFEIAGMSIGITLGEIGYVVFCKSRAGNVSLWSWYYSCIVIPTIERGNIFYNYLKVNA